MYWHYINDVETILDKSHAAHFPVWELVWKIPHYTGRGLGGHSRVLVTNAQLGIDSTHSCNGNRESGSPSAHQLDTPSSVWLLTTELAIPWGQVPSPPGPAGPAAVTRLSSGELRDPTPALACIFHFGCNSYSHVDQFLADLMLILQDWTFEPVTLCLAA